MIRGLMLLVMVWFPFVDLFAQSEGEESLEGPKEGNTTSLMPLVWEVIDEYGLVGIRDGSRDCPICRIPVRIIDFDCRTAGRTIREEDLRNTGYRSINEMVALATGCR
jgi:hypothetical protein